MYANLKDRRRTAAGTTTTAAAAQQQIFSHGLVIELHVWVFFAAHSVNGRNVFLREDEGGHLAWSEIERRVTQVC